LHGVSYATTFYFCLARFEDINDAEIKPFHTDSLYF
jgi:hypothetical protein